MSADDTALLFRAIQEGNLLCVQTCLHNGVDPNLQNAIGQTLLLKAIECNEREIVLLLLKYGADINGSTTVFGSTPLHYAAYYGCHELIILLIDQGALIRRRP